MLLMLRAGQSTMVHPSSCTFAVIKVITMSRSRLARDAPTYATVVIQPLAGDGRRVSLGVHEDVLSRWELGVHQRNASLILRPGGVLGVLDLPRGDAHHSLGAVTGNVCHNALP